jgi:hypothetical protein
MKYKPIISILIPHTLPVWKNNLNLDQEYTRYCLVFFFCLYWYILVGYAGIVLVYVGIFWFFSWFKCGLVTVYFSIFSLFLCNTV